MFTQCPECGTLFRVTAEALKMARGTVRCGICSSTFNALEYLSEHPVPRPADDVSQEDTMTVEEMPGNEFIELSGSAEHAGANSRTDDDGDHGDDAVSGADVDPGSAPGRWSEVPVQAEAASGEGVDSFDGIPETALEFHGSAEDLERLFVAADGAGAQRLAHQGDYQPNEVADNGDELERAIGEVAEHEFSGIEVSEEDLPWPWTATTGSDDTNPGHIASVLAFRRPDSATPDGDHSSRATGRGAGDEPASRHEYSEPGTRPAADLDATDEYPILVLDGMADEAGHQGDAPAAIEATGTPEAEEAPRLLIPAELRRDARLTAAEELAGPVDFEARTGSRHWPMALGAALLVLALLAQAVHYWREELVRNAVARPWLLRAYGLVGLPLTAPADLSAFELKQLGAATDPAQAGRIKLRASLVNRASFAQPMPLLRLSVQDRFGSTVGVRDVEPGEYLPGGSRDGMALLGASQRADAEVVFVDPGLDAVGFELDVCLREQAGLRCSRDLAGPQP